MYRTINWHHHGAVFSPSVAVGNRYSVVEDWLSTWLPLARFREESPTVDVVGNISVNYSGLGVMEVADNSSDQVF